MMSRILYTILIVINSSFLRVHKVCFELFICFMIDQLKSFPSQLFIWWVVIRRCGKFEPQNLVIYDSVGSPKAIHFVKYHDVDYPIAIHLVEYDSFGYPARSNVRLGPHICVSSRSLSR